MGVFFMDKYGFVYIWFDKVRKMYYVGSHWGTEYDGYVCSSVRMNKSYSSRPQDFKRRIIKNNIPREELLEVEHYYLSFIKDNELGDRYYNMRNKKFNHWSVSENTRKSIGERMSEVNKGRKHNLTPEESAERGRLISEAKLKNKEERIAKGLPARKSPKPYKRRSPSDESNKKRSESVKKAMAKRRELGLKRKGSPSSEEKKRKLREVLTGKTRTDEQKSRIAEANKKSWSEGKYSNRKSNNMKDFIWVTLKGNGKRTRIHKDKYDAEIYYLGRKS